MKRLVYILCIWAAPLSLVAQAPRTLTLQQTLELSLANSAQLKKAQIDRQGLEQKMREGRSAAYPQVNAGVNLDYFPALQTTFLPGEVLGQPDGTYVPVQLGQPWQFTSSINVQQTVYNESLRRSIPAAKVTRSIYDLLIERSEEEITFNTASVFYQALQTEQLLRTVDANLEKLASLQKMAELQLANGYTVPTDVKRLRVARTNLETQRSNLLNGILALRQTLQFLCGLSLDENIQPVEEMESPAADSLRWLVLENQPENATEHRLLLQNIQLNSIQNRSLLGEAWPSLQAYAAGFYQAQRTNANFFDPNARWFGMAAVGFKVQVPVFDGFRRRWRRSQLQLEGEKLQEDRRVLLQAKTLEYRTARNQLQGALKSLHTQEDNVALAREISEKMTLQYREGATPLSDLLSAQTALSEAQTNYWQQVFAYKLAVVKLLKAAGKLEELRKG